VLAHPQPHPLPAHSPPSPKPRSPAPPGPAAAALRGLSLPNTAAATRSLCGRRSGSLSPRGSNFLRCHCFLSPGVLVFLLRIRVLPSLLTLPCGCATPPSRCLFFRARNALSSLGTLTVPGRVTYSCRHASFTSLDRLAFHLDVLVFCPLGTSFRWIYQFSPGMLLFLSGYANFSPVDMLLFPPWTHPSPGCVFFSPEYVTVWSLDTEVCSLDSRAPAPAAPLRGRGAPHAAGDEELTAPPYPSSPARLPSLPAAGRCLSL